VVRLECGIDIEAGRVKMVAESGTTAVSRPRDEATGDPSPDRRSEGLDTLADVVPNPADE
jgi:hypothetical protein